MGDFEKLESCYPRATGKDLRSREAVTYAVTQQRRKGQRKAKKHGTWTKANRKVTCRPDCASACFCSAWELRTGLLHFKRTQRMTIYCDMWRFIWSQISVSTDKIYHKNLCARPHPFVYGCAHTTETKWSPWNRNLTGKASIRSGTLPNSLLFPGLGFSQFFQGHYLQGLRHWGESGGDEGWVRKGAGKGSETKAKVRARLSSTDERAGLM